MFVYDTPEWLDNLLGLPFIGPLFGLFRSRKFYVALMGVVGALVVQLFPVAAPYADTISLVVAGLAAVLIGSIAYEDGKIKMNTEHVTAEFTGFGEDVLDVIADMVIEKMSEEIPAE